MSSPSVLEVKDLVVHYGKAQALHGVTLSVRSREVVAIVGANGAGKTTLLRCITGLVCATSGSIRFEDREVTRKPAHEISRDGIAHIPEGRGILSSLTVKENLRLGSYVAGHIDPALLAMVERWFPVLFARLSDPAGMLSGGQQQMLAIARAVLARPKMVLIDELSLGLAPKTTAELMPRLLDLRDQGASILLVDQNVQQLMRIADRVLILANGRIVHEGSPADVLADPKLMSRYLGVD